MTNKDIYIEDLLPVADRFAIEAKRMRMLGMPLPERFDIGEVLGDRINKADGCSSRFEMLAKLDDIGITYFPGIDTSSYYLKLLVPQDKLGAIEKIVKDSGYDFVKPADNYLPPVPKNI